MLKQVGEIKAFLVDGFCRCGRHFTARAELIAPLEVVEDSTGAIFAIEPAEHLVIVCPYCNRLINLGNGSRRKEN